MFFHDFLKPIFVNRNEAGLWPHDYALPLCEAELSSVDKDKALKAESDRLAKLSGKKASSKKKKKK